MILADIAQGAHMVVKRPATLDAYLLQKLDVDAFNEFAPPCELKKIVRKTEGEYILQHFFRQVVIDAIYLVFLKERAEKFVYLFRGLGIHAKGFLHDDVRPPLPRSARLGESIFGYITQYHFV